MGTFLAGSGEQQVNFPTTFPSIGDGLVGTQADPAVTTLSNGAFAVVYENPFQGTADINLLYQVYNANGQSGENFNFGVDQTLDVTNHPAITTTANSLEFAVAYSDVTAGTIDVRTVNLISGVSSPFTVDGVIHHLPNTHALDNPAIATFANGNMLIAYEQVLSPTDHDLDAAILNPSATGFVSPVGSIASSNAFEGQSRVATFGNTGALVFARDPGTINGGQDIVLLFFNSSGTEIASPTTVFGTNSSDHWSHPDVAALSDGRFVVVAQDDTTGQIAAAICNPATHTVTPLFSLVGSANPHVAGLPGDEFVVTLEYGGDVFFYRFGADGSFQQNGPVESFTAGIQDENAVAANANGTVFFAWQDTGSGNPNSTDTDTRIEAQAFQLVSPHTPAGTSADMIMQDSNTGNLEIYDLGGNTVLAAFPMGQVGLELQFAGLGGFSGSDTSDMLLRNSNNGNFVLYDISNSQVTGAGSLGAVGLNWQVSGFGDFSSNPNETDMLMRDSNTGAFEYYNIANSQITGAGSLGAVGTDWQVLGVGDFSTNLNEADMLMRQNGTNAIEYYDIQHNQIVATGSLGAIGSELQAVAFGCFSGNPNETDMLMRDSNTGAFEYYDIRNNQVVSAGSLGAVGLNWQVVGTGNLSGNPNETDMLMRDSNTGAFEYYDIANNQITGAGSLGSVGLNSHTFGIGVVTNGS